jgi:ribosomal protein L11 methyltransferase
LASNSGAEWQQLTLRLDASDLTLAEALLDLAGARSLTLVGDGDELLLEPPPGATPLWQRIELRALFAPSAHLDPLIVTLDRLLALRTRPCVSRLTTKDWRRASRPRGVRRFGRLRVSGTAPLKASETGPLVKLNFGLAFGTGDHPTTASCLEWLASRLPAGARVVDYGCGSGILALAALALGAERAWAVDIEPQAIIATSENALLNDVTNRLWVGEPVELPPIEADVVLANILLEPLLALLDRFAAILAPRGRLVMSGVVEDQLPVLQAALDARFEVLETSRRSGWLRLDCRRLEARPS